MKEQQKELIESLTELAGFVDAALSHSQHDVFGILHNDALDALLKAESLLKTVQKGEE